MGLAVSAALLAASPGIGLTLWRAASADAEARLAASAPARWASASREIDPVPVPVARFLHRVVPDAQPDIRSAAFVQEAEFFVGGAWRPLSAVQRFTAAPAGFVWDARIQMAPHLPIYVRDAYVGGEGSMRVEFLGLVPVVDVSKRRELDRGALLRYLAESIWFPTALRPGQGLKWEAIDARRARATLTDAHTTVSAEFRFNADGDVAEVFAPDRLREVDGRFVPTPWLVRCAEYQMFSGIRIPVNCEVEWQLREGRLPYWRGRVVRADYDFAE
jgi:hypothetical protein